MQAQVNEAQRRINEEQSEVYQEQSRVSQSGYSRVLEILEAAIQKT